MKISFACSPSNDSGDNLLFVEASGSDCIAGLATPLSRRSRFQRNTEKTIGYRFHFHHSL